MLLKKKKKGPKDKSQVLDRGWRTGCSVSSISRIGLIARCHLSADLKGPSGTAWIPGGRGFRAEGTGGARPTHLRNSKYVVSWCLRDGREAGDEV